MLDPLVKITNVRNAPGFDLHTLTPLTDKVVTFTVGEHGPFTLTYKLADYSDARVQEDIQKQVNELRALGALT